MPKIISLHIPKCAGTSLLQAFEAYYGKDKVFSDYNQSPFNPIKEVSINPEGYFKKCHNDQFKTRMEPYEVIHGHFHPYKYKHFTGHLKITVLRHPVDRLISHYYFWKQKAKHNQPIHDYLLDSNLSIYEFAGLPSLKHFYSKIFLSRIEPDFFDAVFDVSEMDRLEKWLHDRGVTVSIGHTNKTPTRQDDIDYVTLEGILADDVKLYRYAINNRTCAE